LTISDVVRDCVTAFPSARLRVTGRCMEPYLYEGDVVHLVAPDRRAPRFGDVALVQLAGGALRLHRLVWPLLGVGAPSWRSKADRGAFGDGRVEVLATVAGAPRTLGGRRAAWRSLFGRAASHLRRAVGR
jgi:hypothetical protein